MDIPSYLSGAIYMKAYRVLRVQVAGSLERHNLTPTAWVLLGIIRQQKDGIRVADAAQQMNVRAPLVTNMVHDLSKRGYVRRISHLTDKRSKLVVLTADGKEFIKRVETDVNAALAELLIGLTEDDMNAYAKVLSTVITNAAA